MSEAALVRPMRAVILDAFTKIFPTEWTVRDAHDGGLEGSAFRPDVVLVLAAPDRTAVHIFVEIRRRIEPQDVPHLLSQLPVLTATDGDVLLIAAPFLSPRTRALLTAEGISYADATGNFRLAIDRPAVFVVHEGAQSDPGREKRPLHSLKGRAAGRVVRALCDFRPPYGVRALAERSATPVASVSRVVQLLAREAFLVRDSRGMILDVQSPALIRRWADDYALTTSNVAHRLLAPRGLDALLLALPSVLSRYAVTGSLAAARLAPVAPARLATIYVEDAQTAMGLLKLRSVETGTNVLLLEPFDPVVLERTCEDKGVVYAATTQVAVDLLTSPGRGPAEGEELLRWMEGHEDVWRT